MKENSPLSEATPELQKYIGKLLLEKEIPQDSSLLAEHFIKIPSIKKKLFYYECQRCGNNNRTLFGKISCAKCLNTHLYCRNCIMMGRVMECEPLYFLTGEFPSWPSFDEPLTWNGHLTQAQQRASDLLVDAIIQGRKEFLIWAVCGSGKTEMLFPGIEKALQLGKRICIATPRADVVRELKPRIQQAFQDVPVEALYGGSEDTKGTSQLIIATTHQLLRFYRTFDLMIIDEIDAFPYHNDATLPFAVNRAKKNNHTTIYLTATPRQDLRRRIALKQLPHTFVPVRYHGYPLPVPELKMSFTLGKELRENKIPTSLIAWLKSRKNPKRQVLVFVPTIQLADELATLLRKRQLGFHSIESVHAEDSDRMEKVNLFRQKKIDLLVTTTILERGVTFPSVDVVIVNAGHAVFDEAALVQIAGRAGRSKDDPTGEVIFLHDGKTEALVQAVHSIKLMNKRGGFQG